MNCKFLVVILVMNLLALAKSANSQEEIREYGSRVVGGTWHLKDPVSAQDTYQWFLGQQFLKLQHKGGVLGDSLGIIGRDPSNGKQTWWNFRADGSIEKFTVAVQQEPGGVEVATVTSEAGDKIGTFTSTWTKDRIDTETENKIGGKVNKGKRIWERSTEVADLSWLYSKPPMEIPTALACTELLTGAKWVIGKDSRSETIVGATLSGWILDGKFFLYSAAGFDSSHALDNHIIIFGIDPSTEAATAWAFASDGSTATYRLSPNGLAMEGEWIAASSDASMLKGKFEKLENSVRFSGTVDDKPVSYSFYDAQ
ncbi:MAG: hypothetical protein NXI32_04215 [bacterium]|nr:hypothetical protein [bacterium]